MSTPLDGHRPVFVCGLHRSGTTPLARCLSAHPQVSGFAGTGVTEDEGQHLQSVYPPASAHGGPGRFARDPRSHLTEDAPLATPENARRLAEQWAPYWDLDRPVLLEKSPPNLLMTRFLQELYPQASFVVIVRHPVVVTLSTARWRRLQSLSSLFAHWFAAHETFAADAPHLRRLHVVRYEDLIADPGRTLKELGAFLDLDGPIPAETVEGHRSSTYERAWAGYARNPLRRPVRRRLCDRYGAAARRFGYDMHDLDYRGPFPALGT